MKLVALLLAVVVIAAASGFTYVAVKDVPVEQSEIVKTIPNDRFFSAANTQ